MVTSQLEAKGTARSPLEGDKLVRRCGWIVTKLKAKEAEMEGDFVTDQKLLSLKEQLDSLEETRLSPHAALSSRAVRRRAEERLGHRQNYAVDGDRILHSRAYTRYIDKTQVFYMVSNDHITHRVLHVQLVSKIARTIGRFLSLNEDLIEAIALGHDIGHPPFGHDGEKELDRVCREFGLPSFQHNLQSVEFLDRLEKKGRGCNLTLQVLDGIMCHDGEIHNPSLTPARTKDFAVFEREKSAKSHDPDQELVPMTLEGCVVRFSDTIAYVGRDIEDAIELRLIERRDIPRDCSRNLGNTNGTMVYRLVCDLISTSIDQDAIAFSEEISESLRKLKQFNYERIYLNPAIKQGLDRIKRCYRSLFAAYLDDLLNRTGRTAISRDFLDLQGTDFAGQASPAALVRDFISGMTDDYFVKQARLLGCEVPEKR